MMNKTIHMLTVAAAIGFTGSAFAQDAAPSNAMSGAQSAGATAMTCADLNDMAPEHALAFLNGYQYALGATARSEAAAAEGSAATASSEASSSMASSSEPSSAADAAGSQVGAAATTGDVSGAGSADTGTQAILNSCFDAPALSLDEVLNGAFGKLQ